MAKVFIAASASVLPMNIQGWFPSDWLVWSCYCPRKSQESSPTPQFKSRNSLGQAFFMVQLSYLYMPTGKTIALTIRTFVGQVMFLFFTILSRFVIAFLPRSKHLLISWLQSPSAVILEPEKVKSATVATLSPSICYEVVGPDVMTLVCWMLKFKAIFSLLFQLHQEAF